MRGRKTGSPTLTVAVAPRLLPSPAAINSRAQDLAKVIFDGHIRRAMESLESLASSSDFAQRSLIGHSNALKLRKRPKRFFLMQLQSKFENK